jgi:uridine kinase
MTRARVLADLADRVATLARPALVAIDGVDGVGKTVLADDLAAVLAARGIRTVRVPIDGFHRPRAERYRRGRTSPRGYLEDSYDVDAFRACVVEPVRRGGSGAVRPAVFDHRTDRPVDVAPVDVGDAVVLVDGIFLHRDGLAELWDLSLFLRAGFTATFARMAERDGTPPDPEDPANRRYLEGQRLYLRTFEPERRADVVVDLEDLGAPVVVSGLRAAADERRRQSGADQGCP